ncbi:hypothetical protein N7495_006641 [Penicillium taxi]|uniref:uncharacterized protein n=1 Tax=Penicillium taxi TaxID=168475 RepID=UPI0025457BC1|nr:uncharacterized protein N7495_006641 [Penicillium taxi]KAJ5894950.1 hypothetical protein N7495_006641 [Penicillium taxi]
MPESPSEFLDLDQDQIQSIRRSATLPPKLNPHAQRISPAPNLSENVIFYHPSAKIVHFAPRALVPIPSSSAPSDFDYPVDTIETLPWRSAAERTVATAPLRLERIHGITAFLKCGNVVHAILKNSQCWCVDGVSKFVLRIRPLTYYRIELPHETEDNQKLVGDLKTALPTVLRYEVTPCPFKRAFTVDLPEYATAPRRKKAWQPKRKSLVTGRSQASLAEIKLEFPEYGSAGEDTDGTTTDESIVTYFGANSKKSETFAADDLSPSTSSACEFPKIKPLKRSVTDTPQTFTSLRAKFDATPVRQSEAVAEISSVLESRTEPTSEFESEKLELDAIVEAEAESERKSQPVSETKPHVMLQSENESKSKPEVIVKAAVASIDEATAGIPFLDGINGGVEAEMDSLAVTNLSEADHPRVCDEFRTTSPALEATYEPNLKVEANAKTASTPPRTGAMTKLNLEIGHQIKLEDIKLEEGISRVDTKPQADNYISVASSPDSFHSAGSPSRSTSVLDLATPVEYDDWAQKHYETSSASSTIPLSGDSQLSLTQNLEAPCHSVSDKPYPTRECISTSSLSIPSSNQMSQKDTSLETSPTTDFTHMSVEFRRRNRATRTRDFSPMPPISTLYRPPSPTKEAVSMVSKALTLVLVPPISLFIILMHIAARIVINQTSNSNFESSSKFQPLKSPLIDDFSFPLERESSEYENAEISKKSDPWDLD